MDWQQIDTGGHPLILIYHLRNIYIREKFMLFQMICYVDVA